MDVNPRRLTHVTQEVQTINSLSQSYIPTTVAPLIFTTETCIRNLHHNKLFRHVAVSTGS